MKYIYEITVLVERAGIKGYEHQDYKLVTREKGINAVRKVWTQLYGRGFKLVSIDSMELVETQNA